VKTEDARVCSKNARDKTEDARVCSKNARAVKTDAGVNFRLFFVVLEGF
tara:strand:- start:170 stop:316 length:147 start_codon:yes stop_codon:yes gene_type:complete